MNEDVLKQKAVGHARWLARQYGARGPVCCSAGHSEPSIPDFVVAWIRRTYHGTAAIDAVASSIADAIERGEHRKAER